MLDNPHPQSIAVSSQRACGTRALICRALVPPERTNRARARVQEISRGAGTRGDAASPARGAERRGPGRAGRAHRVGDGLEEVLQAPRVRERGRGQHPARRARVGGRAAVDGVPGRGLDVAGVAERDRASVRAWFCVSAHKPVGKGRGQVARARRDAAGPARGAERGRVGAGRARRVGDGLKKVLQAPRGRERGRGQPPARRARVGGRAAVDGVPGRGLDVAGCRVGELRAPGASVAVSTDNADGKRAG